MDATGDLSSGSAASQIVIVESDDANGQETSQCTTLSPAPKTLRSILKRRKPDDETTEEPVSNSGNKVVPVIEKPKGGSITQALKMIASITHGSDDEDFDTEPKPSAFILEMEKQKDNLQIVFPGAFRFPTRLEGIEVADMDWQSTSPPQPKVNSFFVQEQMRLKQKASHIISKPPERKKIKITKGPLTMSTPHEAFVQGIVFINNLPFKVTADELVKILGIWPRGGYDGIKLMVDSAAMPAGYAYVIVEQHCDMMNILRLTGLEMQGRKIRCSMSNQESLIEDWKISKKALAMLNRSRVVRVAHLPYFLEKSELIKALDRVKFNEDDIYWSALISGQTNSGRGFVVLESSKDAKSLSSLKEFRAPTKMIEVAQVHPSEFQNFCKQCKLDIKEKHTLTLTDPITENCEDVSDLNLNCVESKEAPDKSTTSTPSYSNFVVTDEIENPSKLGETNTTGKKTTMIPRRHSRERVIASDGMMPPFRPTIFVRMYNVPDKATFDDIRAFFDPILPAKINQNPAYNVYDLEFYNPDEAMRSMRKHSLLMRKNVISLEMLPRPPFPPRPFHIPQGVAPPGMIPRMGPGISPRHFPPGMGPPGPMMPGLMPLGMRMGLGPLGPVSGLSGPFLPPGSMPGPRGLPIPRGTMPEPHAPLPGPGGPIHGLRRPMLGPSGSGPMPGPRGPMPGPRGPMFGPGCQMMMLPGPMTPGRRSPFPALGVIDPQRMPPPMHDHRSSIDSRSRFQKKSPSPERRIKPKKELIPVPPLPEDFTIYKVPPFKEDTPVGQGLITTMQGYFCQLCNKFYTSRASAKDAHCKTRGHYDRLKQFLHEKKRLRRLAEAENEATRK